MMLRITVSVALLVTYTWMYSWAQDNEENKPEPNALVLEQVCNGFPGTNQKEKTKQKLVIKDDMIYMENLESPHICIVRGDKKLLWEIDKEKKEYKQREFSYFDKLKKDEEVARKNAAKQLNNITDPETRAKTARKLGLKLDDSGEVPDEPIAKTEILEEEKVINGYKCYHMKIYQDYRPVLDLWLTKALPAPQSLLKFYKRLGLFSDPVVEEMEKIRDFPVKLDADLAFGAVTHKIKCEITKVSKENLKSDIFEVPEEFEMTEKITGKDKEVLKKSICPVTGEEVDPNDESAVRFVYKGTAYYFKNKAAYNKFIKKLSEFGGDDKKVCKYFAEERTKAKKDK